MSENLYSSKTHPRRVFPQNGWIEGLSDYNKQGGSYLWARGVDYRTEPSQLQLLPQAVLEAGQGVFTDLPKWAEQVVGRTIILGSNTNLISNNSFETNTTGWTLGADYTRSSDDAYLGTYSIKQVSTTGNATLTTASGSGIPVSQYTDYQLIFYAKITVTSGLPAQLSILGGSLAGPNLLSAPLTLNDTGSLWVPITVSFNAGQYTSVFIVITNEAGTVTAHYDNFSLNQINSLATFALGNNGNLYKRYSNAAWTSVGILPNSHGNGQGYYGEDDFLYVAGDKTLGRYGPISSGTPTLVSDYLTSAGGIPTNTNSPQLIAANSQYFKKATPSSDVKITGDIALEAFIKAASLPVVGSSMTIAGLWNENTNKRAYKLDILGVSGFFSDAADGNITISVNTTDSPTDSACSGTSGTNQLNATNASFAAGQKILVIQMMGTGAGTYQKTTIQSYDSTNHIITTSDNLNFSYNSSGNNAAQVLVVKRYGSVVVNTGVTWTPKAWNGVTGGILAFYANSGATINGTINGNGAQGGQVGDSVGPTTVNNGGGFRGGRGDSSPTTGATSGEGTQGFSTSIHTFGVATGGTGGAGGGDFGGGGGGYGAAGNIASGGATVGGAIGGSQDLTTNLLMGGAGGGGGAGHGAGGGGNSGAIVFIIATSISGSGTIRVNGANGQPPPSSGRGGGGGSGGAILLQCQTLSGTITLSSSAGAGGVGNEGSGGNGGVGRIHIDYLTSQAFSSSTPSAYITQDNTLVTSTTYQVRLGISNDGTAFEYLTQNLQSIAISTWDRLQVSWQASTSTASFYENGNLIGTSIGTKTAIYGASTADFAIGANVGASVYQNFFDGLVNDVRLWNTTRSQAQFSTYDLVNLQGVASGLVGNWFLTNTGNDLTASANNLTATGSPTPGYVTDVPYPGATTRGDVDQTGAGTGQTYTLPTTLTEGQKQSFIPQQDPQKSLGLKISAKGTGDWTIVVHDGLNRQVATVTVLNAQLPTSGLYEFIYTSVFSPVVGATYHFHLYSTVSDGSIVTGTISDITTAQFTTYYQFLVSDTDYHPVMQMGNVIGIGNGRYLAVLNAAGGDGIGTYNGQGYNPRRLRFPAGWRVRALATWRGYYAIGCWKGTTIKDFDQGIVFLWDGYSITYNDFFLVPEGAINAMCGENDTLYIVAGYKGDLLEYTGGASAKKVKRIPKVGNAKYVEVEPGAMTYFGALLRIGVAYSSDSQTLERGVYTWGTLIPDKYPKSLSYDYPVSTGNRGSTVSIGALIPVGGSLLMFYQDGTSFGVNNINAANAPQTTGTIEGLITDFGFVWHDKELQVVRADHLPLPVGANVDVKYKLNYETNWHNLGITNQVVGDQNTRLPLQNILGGSANYHITQIALDLSAQSGISPTILEHSQLTDFLLGEGDENSYYNG